MSENKTESNDIEKIAEESRLNKPLTVKFLLAFTLPTIASYVIMSLFGTVDGVFASRGISAQALSAIMFVDPFFAFTMAIGAMLTMGGSALVAKKKGEKKDREARENFTFIILVTFAVSILMSVAGWLVRVSLLRLLGTDTEVFDLATAYLQPLIIIIPFIMVGIILVQFMIAEGRPVLGMLASGMGAVISTSLNALFILVLDMGIFGLALATGIGYAAPALMGVIYFSINRKGTIYFVRPKWDIKVLGRSSYNGISEMVTMMAATVMTLVLNNVMVRIVGWEGVATAGIVFAAQGIFSSVFFGYAAGIVPVVSYNFGGKNKENLKILYRKSLLIIAVLSTAALIGTVISADLLALIYVSPNDPIVGHLHTMAVWGLRITAIRFILMGFNVFATAWFTAFNDGMISGIMSFMRTAVFSLTLFLTLPRIWGLNGVWIALPGAEVLSIFVTVFFLIKMGKKYFYRA